jgi:thiamine pyrophosphate-dependent acetolactate synthase large subunit-like protein
VRRTHVEQFDSRVLGSELRNPDFVRLAESFGVRGIRATAPAELEGLLREILSGGSEPVVVEVPVGPMPNPLTNCARRATRIAEGARPAPEAMAARLGRRAARRPEMEAGRLGSLECR